MAPGSDRRNSGPYRMDMPLTCFKSSCLEFCSLQVRTAGPSQAFLVAQGSWGVDAALAAQSSYGAIAKVLRDRDLTVVHERLFGSLSVKEAVMATRAAALRAGKLSAEALVTYIQGQPSWGGRTGRGHHPGGGRRGSLDPPGPVQTRGPGLASRGRQVLVL
jgi:hypothetical protein